MNEERVWDVYVQEANSVELQRRGSTQKCAYDEALRFARETLSLESTQAIVLVPEGKSPPNAARRLELVSGQSTFSALNDCLWRGFGGPPDSETNSCEADVDPLDNEDNSWYGEDSDDLKF